MTTARVVRRNDRSVVTRISGMKFYQRAASLEPVLQHTNFAFLIFDLFVTHRTHGVKESKRVRRFD